MKRVDGVVVDPGGDLSPATPKMLLTAEEAAEVLSIGRSKLYELLSSGAIASVTIGTSRRIRLDDLKRFVDELEHQARIARGTRAVSS
jgi:excisionase family DNA binding protein